MCGLSGFIGDSKDFDLTYKIITELFCKLQIRGDDASGFWGNSKSSKVIYYKEPCPSSALVKSSQWQSLKDLQPNLLLMHCRQASFGDPNNNNNNHPFIGKDSKLGFIHNGKVSELFKVKNSYDRVSDCDSEILLRIIESHESKIDGIKSVFSSVRWGHMAAALGDMSNNEIKLHLFRNKYRSLWIADMTKEIGQIFFCSCPEVWPKEILNCKIFTSLYPNFITSLTLRNDVIHKEEIRGKDTWVSKLLRLIKI